MLTKSRAEKRIAREPRVANDSNEVFMPDDNSVAESASTWGVVQVDSVTGGDPTEDLKMPSSRLPWAVCASFRFPDRTLTVFSDTDVFSVREQWIDDHLHDPLP